MNKNISCIASDPRIWSLDRRTQNTKTTRFSARIIPNFRDEESLCTLAVAPVSAYYPGRSLQQRSVLVRHVRADFFHFGEVHDETGGVFAVDEVVVCEDIALVGRRLHDESRPCILKKMLQYRVDGVDVAQETERN